MDERLNPGSSKWFDSSPAYTGRAKAEFTNPNGFIEGPATVRFTELGEAQVEMTVDEFHSERPLRGGALEFFHDGTLIEKDGKWSLGFGTGVNRCERLSILDPSGVFAAEDNILHYEDINGIADDPIGTLVRFSLVHSRFDAQRAGSPKYWAIPLLNYVSDFAWGTSPVDQHPLRIRTVPEIPGGMSEEEVRRRKLAAQVGNRLILFEYDGAYGFIEPLPKANWLMEQLRKGKQSHATTAIVVGELGAIGLPPSDLSSWPAMGLFPLLSLATGVEVGAPWLELRDEAGLLVKRLHTQILAEPYAWGRGVIPHVVPQAIGYLLSRAFVSPFYGVDHFRVALMDWRRAGQTGNVDERLRHLFTAFESLLSCHGLKTTRLRDSLTPQCQTSVDTVIQEAAVKIRELGAEAARQNLLADHATLGRIESKVVNAANIDGDFGVRVAELLRRYSLPDAEVIDRYFLQHPGTDGCETWSDVLSMYRGSVIHEGFLDVRSAVDRDEAYRFAVHLQDVLARILLKMAGYDGQYQPMTTIGTAPTSVDWVEPTTTAARLGLA